jgi:hypothetical protein
MFESIFHVRFFKEAVSTPKTIIDFLTYLNALHEHIMRLDFPLISLANEIHKINAYPASTNIKIKMSPSLSNLFRYNFFLFAHPLIEGAENDKDFMGIACAALLGEPNSDFVTNLRKFDNLFKDIHLERFTGLLTDTFTGSTQDEGQCLKNLWLNMKRHPAASTSSLSIPLSLVRASSSSSSQAPAPPPRVGVTLEGVLGYPAEPLYSTVQPRSLDVARRVPPPVAPRPDKK